MFKTTYKITRIFILFLCLNLLFFCVPFFACENEAESVNIKYYAKAEEMVPMLKTGKLNIGLLPEPAVSNLKNISTDKEWSVLSLQELYDGENKTYPQAVMMIKESLLFSFPDIVNYLSENFDSGIEWIKNNPSIAVNSINIKLEEGLVPSLKPNISSETIKNCNVFFQDAISSREQVNKYIEDMIKLEKTAINRVGGDFFYTGSVSGESFKGSSITVVSPDGAPSLSIGKLIYDNDDLRTGKPVNYKIVSSDKIGMQMAKGLGDIVICPINAATKLYASNPNCSYKMVSVLTHGNLYIVSDKRISLNELKGKTVGVIGQGLVPDLTFRVVLKKYGIETEVAL